MAGNDSRLVLTEAEGGITTVRLNRPDKRNALSDELLEALVATLSDLHEDPAEGLMITGSGPVTCAGRDIDVVSQPDFVPGDLTRRLSELISTYPRPTAMAGKGAVIGQGFTMGLRCDFLVLGEEAHYSYPEITYDIDGSNTIGLLAEYVGPGVAKEIVMTGQPIEPERAYDLGLVNDVVPEEEVEERTRDLLREIIGHDFDIVSNMIAESRLAKQ